MSLTLDGISDTAHSLQKTKDGKAKRYQVEQVVKALERLLEK
jgi:hypothetical protein